MLAAAARKGKKGRRILEITLKGAEGAMRLTDVRLLSKPSRRLYVGYKDIKKSKHGGIVLLSTPKGVLSSNEAWRQKVGGQLIAEIW